MAEALDVRRQLGGAELAYIGDAVHELHVRLEEVRRPGARADLHARVVRRVQAGHQARMLDAIWGRLTEEERAAARRGRNARERTRSGVSSSVRHHSQSFEALIGHLFLAGAHARIEELLQMADPAHA